jgi:hypothetical protein
MRPCPRNRQARGGYERRLPTTTRNLDWRLNVRRINAEKAAEEYRCHANGTFDALTAVTALGDLVAVGRLPQGGLGRATAG